MKIREKKIYSGKLFEAEFFSVASDGRRYSRGKKKEPSRAVQKKLNDKNAKKKVCRLIEANFTAEDDYYCTFTFSDEKMPSTYEDCKREIRNYLSRLRRARNRAKLPELKYIYVIEHKKRGFHFHIVMSGGLTRKEIKSLWGNGGVMKVEELQEGERGFEALSKYFCKEWNRSESDMPESAKRYTPSRNLKQPTEKKRDGVFKPRYLEKLCKQRIDDADYWENRYKNYRFITAEAVFNEDYGTWSLNVTMRKRE